MKNTKPKDIGRLLANTRLIEATLQKAVREALLQHKRAGNPVAEWRDGKVVWVQPEDIGVATKRRRCGARKRQTR